VAEAVERELARRAEPDPTEGGVTIWDQTDEPSRPWPWDVSDEERERRRHDAEALCGSGAVCLAVRCASPTLCCAPSTPRPADRGDLRTMLAREALELARADTDDALDPHLAAAIVARIPARGAAGGPETWAQLGCRVWRRPMPLLLDNDRGPQHPADAPRFSRKTLRASCASMARRWQAESRSRPGARRGQCTRVPTIR
jgi:hypothetical protein